MANVSAAIRRKSLSEKLRDINWSAAEAELDARGHAVLKGPLSQAQCAAAASLYQEAARFRKTIGMGRYNFGQGGRGVYRVAMRHGVSQVLPGRRQTLGIIFHDAQ